MELSIEQRVHAVISHELGVREDEIYSDARIREDLGADSMDSYSLVQALEDEFSIEITDSDIGELLTVRNLVHYIAVRAGAAT